MLVATLGAAMTTGLLGPGNGGGPSTYLAGNASLIVTAKHAIAYGASNSDGYAVDASTRQLMDISVKPWRAFAAAGGRGLMVSHPTVNGLPMHANGPLLNGLLRTQLGLAGALFGSDYGNVAWLSDAFHFVPDHAAAAIAAVSAGVDQEMSGPADSLFAANLPAAVASGALNESVVDAAAGRVLRAKFAARLFDDRQMVDPAAADAAVHTPAAVALTREAATQGITLLTNGAGVLPRALPAGTSVAVLGPNGGGCPADVTQSCPARVAQVGAYSPYSSAGPRHAPRAPTSGTGGASLPVYTVEDALRAEAGLQVTYAAGASIDSPAFNGSVLAEAVAAAAAADFVVLVLGDDHHSCAEGTGDRTSLDLPGTQLLLLQAVLNATGNLANASLPGELQAAGVVPFTRPGGPIPVAVVLIHSRPATFDASRGNWLLPGMPGTGASALLSAWQPSEQGGFAILDVLTGRVAPSGHLAQAWPRSVGHIRTPSNPYWQLPNSQGSGAWMEPVYDTWEPLFPFAHGLSYTTWGVSGLAVSPGGDGAPVPANASAAFAVSLTVANTGGVDATALVQVYVTPRVAGVVRYVNKLAGWTAAAVAAGASAPVTVAVAQADLDRWDEASAAWVVDPGEYTFYAGLCWSSNGLYAAEGSTFPCTQLSATVAVVAA